MKRSFLFLQGVCSPFFPVLADQLKAMGHHVFKVNFNVGDVYYWGRRPSWAFRGRAEQFDDFLQKKVHRGHITDIVLFGDCRPVHRPAIEHAKRQGIRIHVYEEGYFRPYWITLEREGVNAHSLLPRDPAWYRHVAHKLPGELSAEPFVSPLLVRAQHDVRYHLASFLNPLLFPGYRNHAPVIAPVQYAAYSRRFAMMPYLKKRDRKIVHYLCSGKHPFYLLPLQLSSDAQIRKHSDFKDMSAVIEFVMESFALHAPHESKLVIKNHPLDTGLVNYPRQISSLERRFGLEGRTVYLESGDLNLLLDHARGVVTVNSTVGAQALVQHCPTIALSDPIYNLPGLTFQGELNEFWQHGDPPDAELFHSFRWTVIHTTQVNGGFYSNGGIELAVRNSIPRLTAEKSPLELLL